MFKKNKTRSIQRTQTPPRLWPLTLSCDLDLESRSKKLCRLLYCTLVPGMMSVSVIDRELWPLAHFYDLSFDLRLWPSSSVKDAFIFIIGWTLRCCKLVPSTKFVGLIEFEIWTIVWWKHKWRHNDIINHSIFNSTKGISKRHTEFHCDRT